MAPASRRALVASTLVGVALLAVGWVGWLAAWGPDAALRRWEAAAGSGAFRVADALSLVGSTGVSVVVVGALVVLAWWRGQARGAYVAAAGVLAAQLLDALLKVVANRPRPPYALVVEDPWSFPSGHATRAAAFALVFAWLAWHAAWPRPRVVLAAALGAAWALAMGWARLALGVHYASDVVGGWGAGLAGCGLGILVAEALVPAALARLPRWAAGRPCGAPHTMAK